MVYRLRSTSLALVAAGTALLLAQDPIFFDGLEPGSPSSWSQAPGWSCPDGDAPAAGNSTAEAPGDLGCPAGMALVTGFCIDRYEASLALLPEDGGGPWSPYLDPGAVPVRALSVGFRCCADAT